MTTRLPDRAAGIALAALAVAATVSVAVHWGARPEYADRFLILIGAAWAARRAWPTVASAPAPSSAFVGLLFVLVGALAFPVAWLLQVQIGPRTLLLWWQWTAALVAAGGFVLLRRGWGKLRACGFALLFPLLALPIPLRVLLPLQSALQVATTSAAEWLLSMVFTVARPGGGFVLVLSGGPLEVAEACSGVRSLTALVAIAAFVAFLRGFGPVRGGLLLAGSIPVVAGTNVLRVFLSGVIQEAFGAKYIQGDWHEALGFVMVLVGLGGILALAGAMERRSDDTASGENPPPVGVDETRGLRPPLAWNGVAWAAALLLLLSAFGTAYAVRRGWQAVGESLSAVPLDRIPMRLGAWTAARDEPIPDEVTSKLAQDTGLYRVYADALGREVHCWAFYWSSLASVHGYHHPDVCWGNKGGTPTYRAVDVAAPTCGGKLPMTVRRFDVGGGQNFILYWTQDGQRVWDEATEAVASRQGDSPFSSGHGWVADLLNPPKDRPPGRLTVLLVTRHTGPTAERETADLARRLADELYALCPWAAPPHSAE